MAEIQLGVVEARYAMKMLLSILREKWKNEYGEYKHRIADHLRVFADALDGEVYHYRDKNGLECDAVVHLRNGKYGLIEVKLGGDKLINEGAANLITLAGKINTEKMNEPSFMMVLTGTGDFAYRRKDGVFVVPIGCLKD